MKEPVDWAALERMRAVFLGREPLRSAYWRTESDLASYDATLGERIGWKWDAVIRDLNLRGWRPPPGPVLDFGCGSGVAGRRVLESFGTVGVESLWLHDRSGLAMEFARRKAAAAFPGLPVAVAGAALLDGKEPLGTLVVSHVLSELPGRERRRLVALAARAQAILWVEPGTHEDSQALIAVRAELADQFRVVAPCTHGGVCGLLRPGNERHWCHHFARPPWEIFADPDWAEFGRRMGVDLRSVPYSYLVMDRGEESEREAGWSRVLGSPRRYKGYSRVFSCDAGGVRDLRLARRTHSRVLDRMEEPGGPRLYRWQTEGEDVVALSGELPAPGEQSAAAEPDSDSVA
jgi:SAM-dependent methyltransferase